MQEAQYNFKNVSLLITVYNRSSSLKRLLESFRELSVSFGEIIVSDDCSKEEHLAAMRDLQNNFNFKLITTPVNGGLGNNINKGQKAAILPYTLYVQEDFVPKEAFIDNFKNSLEILDTDQSIDTIRFYAYFPYPYTKSYGKGFREMIFEPSLLKWNHLKFYVYSDHPHVRRNNFLEKFGAYQEGIKMDNTEFFMSLSFIGKKGRALIANDINESFDQKNSPDEPSTVGRQSWKEKDNFLIKTLRQFFLVYRYLKNNIQLLKYK